MRIKTLPLFLTVLMQAGCGEAPSTSRDLIGRVFIDVSGEPRGFAMTIGISVPLTAYVLDLQNRRVTPDPVLTFATSDATKVSVAQSGVVRSHSLGSVWIRASAADSRILPDSILVLVVQPLAGQ